MLYQKDPADYGENDALPSCDSQGFFLPEQCSVFGTCHCVLPNGTALLEAKRTTSSCSEIVGKILGVGKKCLISVFLLSASIKCHRYIHNISITLN